MSRKSSLVLKQSGVIPYRIINGKIEVLLISTRRSQRLVIPKGGIYKAMTPPDSAAKEAWEEAGVVGQVDDHILGSYSYRKRGKTYRVLVYLLRVETVLSDWQEASIRTRQWLDVKEAVKQVKPSALKRILLTSDNQITSMTAAELHCN